ncbi:MAG: bifunctional hydroxymethylpyrimidine kinase/phosphomethylpyrimidine kinase [Microbacterium sp. 71-36]|uniref:bifunctional hydroxymethylpyrimidine kinase/phosphomethylpyrimidine kinase n=1 Tax=unclassified Microbacterium TaxID=2609290 RepID=UPI00086B02B9|nr:MULTISPECIES: bifunctional hydroxymethylpyrimidine kinase/phosphomethylpyrimidine kinase [unclassified Microbacterium]MBN9213161.1 bifunctional hydroxymethylpyrimidine kinase/phosphomethylpyrimidine kinase [Microbacterium sp.]ODT40294.1 MAG: bifunctional hydroxymethylpyrimidine kinase/phosphomethylpyrimidine kinase [Microbacterium sp. SCN 71-17]ODU50694.1 MAG: bifunctional hydroxymethylpyrimidine kinase/phosphomethylpyrimidine kinase [Microbacterium sp. SCN 70-10]OJV78453.1 MAG: bifunctional
MIPRVLSIAGTDPTGGAGVQADLKSISAFGGYGMAAVTALVAQNTLGVREVHVPPTDFLTAQLRAVSDDVEIDAVKIGMLGSAEVVAVVARWLTETRPPVVVLDPVMIATSGDRLLDADAEAAVRDLCRLADLVTPNLPELAVLVGEPVAADWDTAVAQAQALAARADTTVLLKGGHLTGEESPDAVVDAAGIHPVPGRRVATPHTHGTGCSLSSAMATLAAHGLPWPDALVRAKRWLTGALENAAELHVGRGNGPIDHLHELRPHLDLAPSWSAARWAEAAAVRADVDDCPFVRGLASGDLDRAAFTWYLGQDLLYLREYARVLARAAALAPRTEEQRFWAAASVSCLAEEASLHESHVDATGLVPAAATVAYTDHLHAVSADGSYAVLVAAVLPCFVLYTDIGARWRGTFTPDHAYADWLTAYGDETFAVSSAEASRIADAAARDASPATRAAMGHAYARSMRRELAFFEAPLRR